MKSFTPSESGILLTGRILPAVQLLATLAILGLPIGNVVKLAAFAATWAVTFRRLSWREALCYLGVSMLFSVMDIGSVHQGIFRFSHADIAGLPIWEYFMWGFVVLHVLRTLSGPPPLPSWRLVMPLAVMFALPFATLRHPSLLLLASGSALVVALIFFHTTRDLYYVAYTIILGAAVEYVGVWSGQWEYPDPPVGGVALWFITMWAGIGLFIHRLVLPWVAEEKHASKLSSGLMH